MEYVLKNILDVCNVYQPKTISTKQFVTDGEYIVYGANGEIGRYNDYNHKDSEVLMACRGATCGAINVSKPYSWINGNAMVIQPNGSVPIDKKYLKYFLMSIDKNKLISGTAQPQITRQNMSRFKLLVCDLDIQKKIVSIIEGLFSELDKAEENLLKIKSQLEIYKQAVLKEAFSGANYNAVNCKIKDVCESIKVGIVIKPAQYYTDEKTGIKSFRSANVREFHIEDKDWVYINEEGNKKNQRSIVHEGDILIVRSGYPGTACVVPKEYDGCNAIDILIASPKKDVILSDYLCAYTNSPFGKMLVREKKRGVAQAHLNVTGYSNLSISVPSIGQQQQILRKIDNMLSKYSSIERTIEDSIMRLNSLRQSILKEAFEGKLV